MSSKTTTFMVGAATAAHQVEGSNKNSDFWVMENVPNSMYKEPSLDAADHYHRFKEDIQLLHDAGLNSYRFSIEWARVEPTNGIFDVSEIKHYRDVLTFCHSLGVTPIVTLHHFSSPKWLIQEGGWESSKTVDYFERYARKVVSELGSLIPYICTINEANMGKQITKIMKRMTGSSYQSKEKEVNAQVGLNTKFAKMESYYREIGKAFNLDPRKIHTFLMPRSEQGEEIIMQCHQRARAAIKEKAPEIKVGLTLSLYDHQALPGGEDHVEKEQYEDFLVYLPALESDDFLGVQNYSRKIHDANGIIAKDEKTRLTKMGYEYYPEALENVLRFVSKHWKKPIIVTENGVSTSDDTERVEFIEKAFNGVQNCVQGGLPVIGYLYWSLLDNFEWQLGYDQTFGLIEVDRATQKRFPKESLRYLGKVGKESH